MSLIFKGMYRFGPFRLNVEEAILRRGDSVVPLPPKVFDLLVLLAANGEGVLPKEEIFQKLWPDVTVEESNLSQTVFTLRRRLGQTPSGEEYVETVPRRGYRLNVPVQEVASPGGQKEAVEVPASHGEKARSGFAHRRWMIAAALGLSAIVLTMLFQARPRRLSSLSYSQLSRDGMEKRGPARTRGGPAAALLTDGSRIYFTEGVPGETRLVQISVSGGDTVAIPVNFSMTQLVGYSPARSELLVGGYSHPASTHRLWAVSLPGGASHLIGDIEASDAAWSPDASQMAFTEGAELYKASSSGSQVVHLATLPGVSWRPRWSPDSRTIRLTVLDKRNKDKSLWEVAADGSGLRPLLPHWNQPSEQCCGEWSKDGKEFVFASTREGKTEIWSMPATNRLFHWLHLDAPQKITSAPGDLLSPLLSPDGTSMYVLGQQLRGELVRYDAQQHQFVPYLGGRSYDFLEFSPSGAWITYVAYPEGTLWRSRPDGSERLQLTFPPMRAMLPHWSPDGHEIVFHGLGSGSLNRDYTVSADGSVPKPVLEEAVMSLNWSPDGRSFLYSDFPFFETRPEDTAVHLLDRSTGQVANIPGSTGLVSPVESPDGRYIVASRAAGTRDTMIFDTRTQTWSVLGQSIGIPRWSRDSKSLFYFRGGDQPAIMRIQVENRRAVEVADLKSVRITGALPGIQLSLSPNDSPILLRDTGTQEIYSVSLGSQ